jgi:hypothetical protein
VEPAAGKSPRTQRAKGSKPKEASRSKPPAGRVLPASRPKLRPARSDEQKHAEAKKFVDFFQQAPLTSELDEKFLAGLAACFIEIHWTFDLMLAVYKNATWVHVISSNFVLSESEGKVDMLHKLSDIFYNL